MSSSQVSRSVDEYPIQDSQNTDSSYHHTENTQNAEQNIHPSHDHSRTHVDQERGASASPLSILMHAAGFSFLIFGFLGRVPAAFNQLGMLLIVSASGRGLAAAGATVAAVGLGTAIGAPLMGRAVDRFGPVRVIIAAIIGQSAALLGVMCALRMEAPTMAILLCAALLGAMNPQVGSIARACWSGIARRQNKQSLSLRTIRLGFGFETAADETSFVAGPVGAGLFVTFFGALGAVNILLASTIIFEGAFALWLAHHPHVWKGATSKGEHRSEEIHAQTQRNKKISYSALMPSLLVIFSIGIVFGATQTALTAINSAAGNDALTGPMYGAMGITSACAGLISPSLPFSLRSKVCVGGILVALCSMAISTLPGVALTLVLILIMGAGVGNALSNSYTAVESFAPAGRLTTVMTVAATCLVLGVSSGSLLGGILGDNLHFANIPAVAAGIIIMCVTLFFPLATTLGNSAEKKRIRPSA